MKRLLPLMFLALGWSTAGLADTDSRTDGTVADAELGWSFASCLAYHSRSEAEALLTAEPGTRASRAALHSLMHASEDRCHRHIVYRDRDPEEDLLRGQVSQGLYLLKYPEAAPPSIDQAEVSTVDVEAYNRRVAAAADIEAELVMIFADCVVAATPADVDRLVRADMDSPDEADAMAALRDQFAPCLWQGQSAQFSGEALRAALAAALYRKSEGRDWIRRNQLAYEEAVE